MSKKRLAIYGGSFNPITVAHLEVIRRMSRLADHVAVMPAGRHADKSNLVDFRHRFKMCQEAVEAQKLSNVSVSSFEEHSQIFETYDLLEMYQEIVTPKYEICFVVGSDVAKCMKAWRTGEKLIKRFPCYVFTPHSYLVDTDNWYFHEPHTLLHCKSTVHSSHVRSLLESNKSVEGLLLPSTVEYIQQNGLYF